jgi:hypothetical protein
MYLLFTPDETGTTRGSGYATVEYASDAEDETVVETTTDKLAGVFEQAKADGGTLDGVDETLDDAISDPLSYTDYLILDDTGAIVFDDAHVRESDDSTTGSE